MTLHLYLLSINDISWIAIFLSSCIIVYIITGKYFLINNRRSADFSIQHYMVGVVTVLSMCCALINLTIEDKVYLPRSVDIEIEDILVIPPTWQKPVDLAPPPTEINKSIVIPTPVVKVVPVKLLKESFTKEDFIDEQQQEGIYNVDSMMQSTKAHIPENTVRPDDNEIIFIPEQMPRFPGCDSLDLSTEEKHKCSVKRLLSFIYKNVKYPQIDKEYRNEGTVIIRFVVDKGGMISDVKILRDVGIQCGIEAMRVVEMMNEMDEMWTPGKQRGRPVNVQYTLPIKFKLM